MSEIRRLAYTRIEAAEALGVSVCSVDRLIKKRQIRCARVLGRTLIPVAELEKVLNTDSVPRSDGRKSNGRKPKITRHYTENVDELLRE